MSKFILLLFLLPVFCIAQNDTETKAYTQAIGEYIKALHKKDKTTFDTLFIGKHEEFPEISLPARIEKTTIIVMPFEEIEKKYAQNNSLHYINIIGTFNKATTEFMIVTFITEKTPAKINWWPLHNCHIHYKNSNSKKGNKFSKLWFEYPYENKFTDGHDGH